MAVPHGWRSRASVRRTTGPRQPLPRPPQADAPRRERRATASGPTLRAPADSPPRSRSARCRADDSVHRAAASRTRAESPWSLCAATRGPRPHGHRDSVNARNARQPNASNGSSSNTSDTYRTNPSSTLSTYRLLPRTAPVRRNQTPHKPKTKVACHQPEAGGRATGQRPQSTPAFSGRRIRPTNLCTKAS